jgi:hypothetical protein
MKIRYTGPADKVDLAPSAGGHTFNRGEAIDVDDELGKTLLAQGTFEKVPPKGHGSAARSNPDTNVETR